jgi:hypothetical protein
MRLTKTQRLEATTRARELVEGRLKTPLPSAGIYYAVLCAEGWRLFPYRYDEFSDLVDHVEMWDELVAHFVARKWAKTTKKAADLEEHLKKYTYAFPRGRVYRDGVATASPTEMIFLPRCREAWSSVHSAYRAKRSGNLTLMNKCREWTKRLSDAFSA